MILLYNNILILLVNELYQLINRNGLKSD